jgi:hypothetical protein
MEEGASRYRCHTCSRGGEVTQLLWALTRLSKQDYKDIANWVQEKNSASVAELQYRQDRLQYGPPPPRVVAGIKVSGKLALRAPEDKELVVLPDSLLDRHSPPPPEVAHWLVNERNFSLDLLDQWEVGWHEHARRVAFPIRDCQGQLVGISGRAFDYPDQKPKFMHSTGFRRDLFLYGERKRDPAVRRAILVEGFFDVIKLWGLGYRNVFGVMGSYLSKFQAEKIVRWVDKVVILPDGDKPGKEAADRWESELIGRVPVHVLVTPTGKDPDELDEETRLRLLGPVDVVP